MSKDKITASDDTSPVDLPYYPFALPINDTPTQPDDQGVSSVSQSDSTAVVLAPYAGSPFLDSPHSTEAAPQAGPTDTFMIIDKSKDKLQRVALSVLDAWLDSLKRQGEEIRRKINSPYFQEVQQQHTPLYLQRMAELTPLHQQVNSITALTNSINNYLERVHDGDSNAASVLTFIAAIATVAMTSVGPAVAIEQTMHTGFGEVLQHVGTIVIAEDMRAELGLIGTLMMSSLVYHTTAETIVDPDHHKAKGKAKNLVFAERYAQNVIKLIKSNQTELFFEAKEKHIAHLVLLSVALALINKIEVKRNTDMEFVGMLTGEITFKSEDIRSELVKLILQTLKQLPQHSKSLIKSLMSYFNTDPDVEALLNTKHVFESLLKHMPVHTDVPG